MSSILDELSESTQTTEALRSRVGKADQEARGYEVLKRAFINVLIPATIASIFIPYVGMVFAAGAWFASSLAGGAFVMRIHTVKDFLYRTAQGCFWIAFSAVFTAYLLDMAGAQPWASTVISVACALFTLMNFRRIIDLGKVAKHVAEQLNNV